jgi:NodT family efflux transporter outer membrane factor (OMF) lipoprotein
MKSKAVLIRFGASLGVVMSLLLCACNPAPKYARPPAQTPTAFKEAVPQEYKEDAGWKIAQPGDDKLRGKWWEIYNEPQLNTLEEKIAISNQSILQAEANFRLARAEVVAARSSLFPTLTSTPAYTNSRNSATAHTFAVGGSTTASGSTVNNNYSLPFDLSYTVDLWHRLRNTVAADAFTAQATKADVGTALLTTQSEVAQDYFEVRSLDAQRQLLQDTLDNYRKSLQLVQSLFSAGIDSDEDVAQAQTQVDTATAQLTDLGVSRATYEHAIAVLTGQPPSVFSLPVAKFVPNPPDVPVALPSELLERRPDVAAAERRVAAANAQIGVARTAYYPNLTLNAAGGFQTASFTKWFDWPSRFWSLGPSLSATLLDVGARRAANEEAQASYDAAVATYRGTVLSAFQAVEDNLATLRILSKEIGEQHTAVISASHYLDLSLTRFKAGVDSYLNVITAQNTVLTNRQTELQIQLRQMTASVGLVMALGGGWDPQLPSPRDLLAKPPKGQPSGSAPVVPVTAPGAPNPPPLNSGPATPPTR